MTVGPRILVLGAGGVGGYFGGRLAESGANVTFLVRPGRADQIARDGLRVESPLGNISLPARTVLAPDLRPDFDLVLLTCKAYDLDSAMDAIAPAVGGDCAIVPLLNGIVHLDRLDARFGRERVLGGSCGIDATLLPDGIVRHGGGLQRIVFGERDRSKTPRVQAFADVLGRTSLDWELADDVMLRMWEKVVFLSVLAATTCLFRGNVQEIISAPGGRDAIERGLATTIETARREGFAPSAGAIAFARDRLLDPNGHWSASMMRDMEAGRPVEADHIVGWMIERARANGVPHDGVLPLAYTHLKTYERRRANNRLPGSMPTR
ncbi:MAG: ketopantoate reductase family protein [Vicinamibacterales bacterium]